MKNTLLIRSLIISSFVLLLAAFHLNADEKKSFVIGIENISYFPQYGTLENSNEFIGIARSIFDSFAASKGYQFEYRCLPVNRLYSSLFNKDIDFKYPDSPDWAGKLKEKKQIIYSDSVVDYTDGTLVLAKNQGIPLEKIETIGTIMGFTPIAYQDRISKGTIKITENDSLPNLLKQVLNERIQGAYVNVDVGLYNLSIMKPKTAELVFDKNLPYVSASYCLSTISHPEIVEEFNQFLKSNKAYIYSLKRIYFNRDL